jgi:TonB family protein
MLLSFVYPFISFTGWLEKQEPMQQIVINYRELQEITITARSASILTIENVLWALYALISVVLLGKILVQLVSILRWKLKGEKQILQETEIISIKETITPFSFFNLIFMNPTLHTEPEAKQILAHEQTHARQIHSLDVLLGELLTIACWFNPAAWLLKREIRQNLEFLADNKVLQSGFDAKNYQYHLLQLSYQIPTVPLVNKFNVLPIKKRIIMMNQQKTAKAGLLKYSLIVPLALALILSSNAQTIVNSAKKTLSSTKDSIKVTKSKVVVNNNVVDTKKETQESVTTTVQDSKPTNQKPDNKDIYTVIEKMPQFPGGEEALITYITQNVRYPKEAMERGGQGTVVIRFIINSNGKVIDPIFLRTSVSEDNKSVGASDQKVAELLNQEALRVINSLPDFIPGEQNGEKVSVYYTLPIVFRLDNDISKEKSPNVGVQYGAKDYNNSGVAPKLKESDPNYPPVFVIDGKIQSKDFKINTIKPETIERVSVVRPDTEAKKAELISKYGENAAYGVVSIILKK